MLTLPAQTLIQITSPSPNFSFAHESHWAKIKTSRSVCVTGRTGVGRPRTRGQMQPALVSVNEGVPELLAHPSTGCPRRPLHCSGTAEQLQQSPLGPGSQIHPLSGPSSEKACRCFREPLKSNVSSLGNFGTCGYTTGTAKE